MIDTFSLYCPTCGALQAADAQTCAACGNPLSLAGPETLETPARTRSGQLPPQHLLHERYRTLQRIGAGGFGAVYQGEDTQTGNRLVAIKEMSQARLSPQDLQEATAAFHREAQLLKELAHPGLPHIYAHFNEGGRWYLVMDFITGETLEAALARQGGRLPLKDVLALGIQLCEVLEYLHTRQPPVIFRDLKPANVMLAPDVLLAPEQRVYLIDFGIARHFTPGKRHDTVAFGSPGYAAPEQYGTAQTTPRSDIYSLGVLLHQMLTGSDPAEQPVHVALVTVAASAGLADLIAQMVDPDPEQRPAGMAVVRAALERLLAAWQLAQVRASAARRASPVLAPTLPQSQPRRKWGRYIAWAIVLVPILACVGISFAISAATPPLGLSNVHIGTGDTSGNISTETTTFTTDDLLVITFTVKTPGNSGGGVELFVTDQSNGILPFSDTLYVNAGTSNGYFAARLFSPGTFTVELEYNDNIEYTNTITVTSY